MGLRKREQDEDDERERRGSEVEGWRERGGARARMSLRAGAFARARARRDHRRARLLAEAAETRESIGQGGTRDRGRHCDKTATIYSCVALRSYPEVFPLGAE